MLTILQVFVCLAPDTVPITTSWWGKDPGVSEMGVVPDSDILVWAESLLATPTVASGRAPTTLTLPYLTLSPVL